MRIISVFIFLITSGFGNQFNIKNGTITYFGDHYLHQWKGVSTTIKGNFYFNKSDMNYHCSVAVPLNSFSSGNSNRDSNMLIYCKSIEFPMISFNSKSINLKENIAYIIGDLVFAGVKKELETKAKIAQMPDGSLLANGEFELLLSDFSIDRPSLFFGKIEDNILIQFSIEGVIHE